MQSWSPELSLRVLLERHEILNPTFRVLRNPNT